VAAAARIGVTPDDDHDATLTALLDQVKGDDDARQQFVDILELMGPDDPRTAEYRRKLTQRLF
jgi:putative thioredoxin